MISEPTALVSGNFQNAWLEVCRRLIAVRWELRNVVVHIRNPMECAAEFHNRYEAFARGQSLLSAKQVAYTIFPHHLYATRKAAKELFHTYNRPGGFYERVKTGWGTYFRRMTAYEGRDGTVNQLEKIIAAIRKRESTSTAAYTVVIQQPGGETIRPLGGPCLNYVAVQLEPASEDHAMTIGLLAVYRNHDFLERAYGNYWGLCNLLLFLAAEIEAAPGPLTCVSSHAYIASKRAALRTFVGTL